MEERKMSDVLKQMRRLAISSAVDCIH